VRSNFVIMRVQRNPTISKLLNKHVFKCREYIRVGFEILTKLIMKNSVFWAIRPLRPMKINRRFGEFSRLYFRGPRISQARSQQLIFNRPLSFISQNSFTIYEYLHFMKNTSCNAAIQFLTRF
jgi:hypothetical protein